MDGAAGVFVRLLEVAGELGSVGEAFLYDSGYIAIEGQDGEGGRFCLTLERKKAGPEGAPKAGG